MPQLDIDTMPFFVDDIYLLFSASYFFFYIYLMIANVVYVNIEYFVDAELSKF